VNSDRVKSSPAEIFQKFKAITEPALIYIDDLHFADEKSLFMFHRMINEGNPFVNFIATTIGRDKIKITPLAYYETLLIDLKPFDAKDIQSITKIASGIDISLKISKELQKSTGGNPLFVTGILPYITKDIEKTGEVPYSLQEIILMKLNGIPGKGPEFVDGGSVYGDIFDKDVLKDVLNLNQVLISEIIRKAENEGLVRKSLSGAELEFSNTIIREIIYERLLKKKIDFFRIKISEAIIRSKTKDLNKLYKAMIMFFLADDERSLDLALKLAHIYKKRSERDILRNIFFRSFEFILKHGWNDKAIAFYEILSEIGHVNIGSEITKLIEQIALKVKNWRGRERIILDLARTINSIQFKEPMELLDVYKRLKGEDKYYKWIKVKTCAYSMPHKEAVFILKSLMNSFNGDEKTAFYFDLVWYMFFITGDTATEKEGMKYLDSSIDKMNDGIKVDYYFLKNTIAMHRDDLAESKRCLDIVQKLRMNDADDIFVLYNDLAILYSNLAYENFDSEDIRKALKFSVKSQKSLKDNQKDSDLPLITTNLAGFYMSLGFIKKSERAYIEGLYYGMAIDHPVEVPYTKSRIAIVAAYSGAYGLAVKLSDEVISAKVADIKSGAYAIRYYFSGTNENDIREAHKYAKEYSEFGTAKCYWEMAGIMIYNALISNDRKEMKELRKKLINWNKFQQRAGSKFVNDAHIEILGLLTGTGSEEAKVQEKLNKVIKLNANYGLMNKCYYALGIYRKDPALLIKAKKYALKMKSYPFVLRIETDLLRITGKDYWRHRIKMTQEKLERMNRIDTIEELFGFKK
jgi:DNA gyrase inhibitor GyrI